MKASARSTWRDERTAAEYEQRRFSSPLQRWKQRHDERLVLDLLGRVPGLARVLDLPCGTGRLLPALERAGYRVVGADVSLEMLRAGRARERERVPRVQADATRLPFQSGAFDAVVSVRFLFHLQPEERRAALAELGRVSGDGVVVGQVRYRWTLKHLGRKLRQRLGLAERYRPSQGRGGIARELQQAGLELVALRPVSRLFSDKALFLARTRVSARDGHPVDLGGEP